MLLEGTNTSDYSEYDLITIDSKAYTVNGYPIQISSIHVVNTNEILDRKQKILEEIDKYIINKKKELFVLIIVDIINIDSILLVKGNLSSSVEKVFDSKLEDNQLQLKGKTSRKKEIYPSIEKSIKELPEYEGNSQSEKSEDPLNSDDEPHIFNIENNISKNIRVNHLIVLFLLIFLLI